MRHGDRHFSGSILRTSTQGQLTFVESNITGNETDTIAFKRRLTNVEIETSTITNDNENIKTRLANSENKISFLEKEVNSLRNENIGLKNIIYEMRDTFNSFRTEVANELADLRKTGVSSGKSFASPSLSAFGRSIFRESMLNTTQANSEAPTSAAFGTNNKILDLTKSSVDSPCFSPYANNDSATFTSKASFFGSPSKFMEETKMIESPHFVIPESAELKSATRMNEEEASQPAELLASMRIKKTSDKVFKPESLVENLVVIGLSKEKVIENCKAQHGFQRVSSEYLVEGKVVFDYGDCANLSRSTAVSAGMESVVASTGLFCKEYGLKSSDADRIFGSKVFRTGGRFSNRYVCSILPHKEEILLAKWDKNVEIYNPQSRLYAFCIKVKDYMILEGQVKGHDKFYHFETIYCLLMYFPVATLAFDILTLLIKEIRLRRKAIFRSTGKRDDADFSSINNILLNDMKSYMNYLFGALAPKPGVSMKYFFKDDRNDCVETIEYTFKEEVEAYMEVSTWNSSKVFSRFSLENIKLIVSAMLLDKPLIFFSSDLKVLTATLNTFLGLLSPFKYVFEIVSLIPEQRMGLCCSPRPILICINRSEEVYMSGELEECSDKILVFIDSKIIYVNEDDTDLKNFPVLDFLVEDLVQDYQFLNSQGSCFEVKRRKEQLDASFLVNPPQPYQRVKRLGPKDYEKSIKKKKIIQGIFKHFRDWMRLNLSNFMPHFSNYNSVQTSAEEVESWINMYIKSKPIREFFYAFRRTQGFLSSLEDLK